MQINNEGFERNILALSTKNADLSRRVSQCAPSPLFSAVPARNGDLIPQIHSAQRDYPLHSRFDPRKEADRYAENHPGGGYFIVFGLGAGYHIEALLRREEITDILIVDRDLSWFRSLLDKADMRPIFLDPRVQLLIDPSPGDLHSYLLSHYHPAVMGDLHTIHLPARTNLDGEAFSLYAEEIRQVTNGLADDYTVQASFGRRWYTNSLLNLPQAAASTVNLPPARHILVAGAGPSLEDQMDMIRSRRREKAKLISTDTALPAFLAADIIPDVIISIDCQQVSYHHFLQGLPPHIPVVLDLATPPSIASLTQRALFFSSGHPFSRYLSRQFRPFPSIDTSGGNVTHAAVSLAHAMGARRIDLYGTDFSYPQGKLYSRGTYIYPYFRARENRLSPLETHMTSFLFRNKNMIRKAQGQGFRYTTKPMISYKERLERALENLPCLVVPAPGLGEPITVPSASQAPPDTPVTAQLVSAGSSRGDWRDFLRQYRRELQELPYPTQPLGRYFAALSHHHKDLWTTLFPAAAHFRQRREESILSGSAILEEARHWSLSILSRIILN